MQELFLNGLEVCPQDCDGVVVVGLEDQKNEIEEIMEKLKVPATSLVHISPPIAALWSMNNFCNQIQEGLIVDIGHSQTTVTLLHQPEEEGYMPQSVYSGSDELCGMQHDVFVKEKLGEQNEIFKSIECE